MNLKLHHVIFIFFLLTFQFNEALQESKKCQCELLKESDVNDQKIIELATEIETSFHNLSTEGFENNFDSSAFVANVLKDTDADLNDGFTQGFMKGVGDTSEKLADKILGEINNGAYYNLINYRYNIIEKAYYFTFRIYSEATGINYHDYKVCTDGETLKVNDIYIYITGEHLSETMKRIFEISMNDQNKLAFDSDKSAVNAMFKVLNARKLAEQGQHLEAYNLIDDIEGSLADEKFLLLIKMMFAAQVDETTYENIISKFAKLYPKDPTLYIKLIDFYILKENYPLVHENIDKLIFETEDDFLNFFKAHVYLLQEDYENAEKYYSYVNKNYPEIFDAYVGEMISLTFQSKFDKTLEIAQFLVDEGYDKKELIEFFEEKELDGTNALDAFVNSNIYKQWKLRS